MFMMGLKGHKPRHARAPVHSRVIHRRDNRVAYRDAAVVAEEHVSAECGEPNPHRGESLQSVALQRNVVGPCVWDGHPQSAEDATSQAWAMDIVAQVVWGPGAPNDAALDALGRV